MSSRQHVAILCVGLSLAAALAMLLVGVPPAFARPGALLSSGLLAVSVSNAPGTSARTARAPASEPAPGLSVEPDWWVAGDQEGAKLGISVGTAGDVNGDGYSDLIVGANLYDNEQTDEGRAYIYFGSANGPGHTADWVVESDWPESIFGFRLGTAGDVNGDGYDDVIVGAPYLSNEQAEEGRVYVYYGSPSGPKDTADWVVESNEFHSRFGNSVGTAGDVNGDGFDDVIIGAPVSDEVQDNEGRVFVYYGSEAGLSLTPDWTAESDQWNARFGLSAHSAGDVNGDGFDDVIVGARNYSHGQEDEGMVFVYHGSATGLSSSPDWTAEGDQAFSEFGWAVASAGDVNRDGYDDVIVGARYYNLGEVEEGAAFVYHGSASGLSTVADWTAEGDQARAWFGYSVGTAGDVNCDGYADVVVGARYYDDAWLDEGAAFVYYGSELGLSGTPEWTGVGGQAGADFGVSTGLARDVDGNSCSDLAVGAALYDAEIIDAGAVFLYYGHPFTLTVINDSPTMLGSTTTMTATVSPGSVVTYTWSLGDGAFAGGAMVTHTYPAARVYTAVVTASNSVVDVAATTRVSIFQHIYLPLLLRSYDGDEPVGSLQ